MPARVMSTVKLSASVVWSSPSDKVSLVSTRTSGSTAEAFKLSGGPRVGVTEGAAQSQSRNLTPKGGGGIHGEILQVDGRQGVGGDGVQLDFIAGGDAGLPTI